MNDRLLSMFGVLLIGACVAVFGCDDDDDLEDLFDDDVGVDGEGGVGGAAGMDGEGGAGDAAGMGGAGGAAGMGGAGGAAGMGGEGGVGVEPLPTCTADFDASCPDAEAVCGVTAEGGGGCMTIGAASCYSSGAFAYQVTPESPVTLTFDGGVNRARLFFATRGAGTGTIRFMDAAGEVVGMADTAGDCSDAMPDPIAVELDGAAVRAEVTAEGANVWIDDFTVNP